MIFYSDFNEQYIQDICDFLNEQGFVIDKFKKIYHKSNLSDPIRYKQATVRNKKRKSQKPKVEAYIKNKLLCG